MSEMYDKPSGLSYYLLPYTEGSLLHEIQETYPGTTFDYRPEGVFCILRPNGRLSDRLAPYIIRQGSA